MRLLLKGFAQQNIVDVGEVVEIIDNVPPLHKKGLAAICYDPSFAFQKSYVLPKAINRRASGLYDSMPIDHILIHAIDNKPHFRHVLLHEIGHHVFRRHLTSVQRKQWVTELYPNSTFVTEYAQTNANEDFAESYSVFIQKASNLSMCPEKEAFLKTIM